MDDKNVIKELCKLKGIGPWSAEMFLMFCLLRPDVLPLGDLGLRRAVGKNYLKTFDPTYEEVEIVAKKWKPYRSAATWFLWKSIDPIAVAY
jgi:DNA-3-methyladenine glycosylase II